MPLPTRPCRSCGRTITWRKKWERDWEQVRYCSSGCRSRGISALDEQIEAELRRLLEGRGRGVSDEAVAEALSRPDAPVAREQVRRAARRLVVEGSAELVQGGQVVDPSTARGPVTIRWPGARR